LDAQEQELLECYENLLSTLQNQLQTKSSVIKKCSTCGISFLTSSRNHGRDDLNCPFGCREAARKFNGNKRSQKHYQTFWGNLKKRVSNQQRYQKPDQKIESETSTSQEINLELYLYIKWMIWEIERKRISYEELLYIYKERQRQRSIGVRKNIRENIAQEASNTS